MPYSEIKKTTFAVTKSSYKSLMDGTTQPEFSSVGKSIDFSKAPNTPLPSGLLLNRFQSNDVSPSMNLECFSNKSSSDTKGNSNHSAQDSAINGSSLITNIQKEAPSCNNPNLSAHVISGKAGGENYNSRTEISSLSAIQFTPIQSVPNVRTSVNFSNPPFPSSIATTESPLPVTANSSQNDIIILDGVNTTNSSCVHENEKFSGQLGSCSADVPITSNFQSAFQISSQVLGLNATQLPASQAESEPLIPPVDAVSLPINSKLTSSSFLKRPLKKPNFENDLKKRILRVLEEPSFWDFVSSANLPHFPNLIQIRLTNIQFSG